MSIDEKFDGMRITNVRRILTRDELRKEMGAPEGKYVVVGWNPSNPEKSVPRPVAEPYSVLNFAAAYASKRNKQWEKQRDEANAAGKSIHEEDYFVMDDQGTRVWP